MKKFIGLLCIMSVLAFTIPKAEAQAPSLVSRYNVALDTVTNTGSKSMSTLRVSGKLQTVTISTVNTLLTGTLSAVARLYGSLDGVNYSRIRSTQLQGLQVDSLVVDPNHRVYNWVVEYSPFQYYQVQTTGVGTVTFTVAGKYAAH